MEDVARIGVNKVECIVLEELKWIFREQPISDYGIDAHIEITDKTYPTGKLIALQIKSGESFFDKINTTKDCIIYYGDLKHYDYWINHSLPVIIVLYNPVTKECIWEHITKMHCQKTEKNWKIEIPRRNVFDRTISDRLMNIANNVTEYQRKFNTFLLAKPWMEKIRAGYEVFLEAEEWINKSSGRGSMVLTIIDPQGKEETVLEWPFVMFPMQNYSDVFPRLFPWAKINIDDDYYYDYEEGQYKLEECPYIDGEYIFYEKEFWEWRKLLPDIRPYENSSGEVDCYRLVLTLNHLGAIFLELNDYLETGDFFVLNDKDIN